MLNAEFDLAMESANRKRSSAPNKLAAHRPSVDRALLSVIHRGKSCFLGNTPPATVDRTPAALSESICEPRAIAGRGVGCSA